MKNTIEYINRLKDHRVIYSESDKAENEVYNCIDELVVDNKEKERIKAILMQYTELLRVEYFKYGYYYNENWIKFY